MHLSRTSLSRIARMQAPMCIQTRTKEIQSGVCYRTNNNKISYRHLSSNNKFVEEAPLNAASKEQPPSNDANSAAKPQDTTKDTDAEKVLKNKENEEYERLVDRSIHGYSAYIQNATMKYGSETIQTYNNLEKILMARMKQSNQRQFRAMVGGSIMGIVIIVYVFGGQMRDWLSQETAVIAKETLGNESLKIQTQELAAAVVQMLLNDKDIAENTATFLREAVTVPETQQALVQLTIHLLQHPDTLRELTSLVQKLVAELSHVHERLSW